MPIRLGAVCRRAERSFDVGTYAVTRTFKANCTTVTQPPSTLTHLWHRVTLQRAEGGSEVLLRKKIFKKTI